MSASCNPIPNAANRLFVRKRQGLTDFDLNKPQTRLLDPFRLCMESSDPEIPWTEFSLRSHALIKAVVSQAACRWAKPTSALVEDLVRRTYLKLCTNNFRALRDREFEHDNALYGFIKVVASNVVHDHFRTAYSQKRGCGREADELEQIPFDMACCRCSVEDAATRILLDEIDGCLADRAVDPAFARDHAIFCLYYKDGLTARATSELPSIRLTAKGVEIVLGHLTLFVRLKLNPQVPTSAFPVAGNSWRN